MREGQHSGTDKQSRALQLVEVQRDMHAASAFDDEHAKVRASVP